MDAVTTQQHGDGEPAVAAPAHNHPLRPTDGAIASPLRPAGDPERQRRQRASLLLALQALA